MYPYSLISYSLLPFSPRRATPAVHSASNWKQPIPMKTIHFTLLGCISLLPPSLAQDFDYSFKEEYPMTLPAALAVSTSDGNVDVMPAEGDVITVYYIVKKDGRFMKVDRKRVEEELVLEVDHDDNELKISVRSRFEHSFNWRDDMDVHFKVFVPTRTSCELRTSDGNITLKEVEGSQLLRTSDGNISIGKINGDVNAQTSDGDVLAENIRGGVELKTSDGNIVLEGIGGNARVSTSDGDIRINKARGDMNLRTSDGNISFNGVSGAFEASTSDGDIVGAIDQLSGRVIARTSDGRIDITVPRGGGLTLSIKGSSLDVPLDDFSGRAEDEHIEGKIRGGGIPVTLSASGGRVRLAWK